MKKINFKSILKKTFKKKQAKKIKKSFKKVKIKKNLIKKVGRPKNSELSNVKLALQAKKRLDNEATTCILRLYSCADDTL